MQIRILKKKKKNFFVNLVLWQIILQVLTLSKSFRLVYVLK